MAQHQKIRQFLARNEGSLSVGASTAAAILFAIYTGILTSGLAPGVSLAEIFQRVFALGWLNTVLLAGVGLVIVQVLTLVFGKRAARETQLREGELDPNRS